jgi:putative ABC transport system substrate-binding protein
LLALASASLPLMGDAQTRRYRLGILEFGDPNRPSGEMRSFTERLVQLGLIEGGNLIVDRRYAGGDFSRLAGLAAEVVALKPDVIFTAGGTVTAQAAKKATTAIPIVFDGSNGPVEAGLVSTLARPGGNMTGNAVFGKEMDAKRVQLLGEVMADGSSLGFVAMPLGDDDLAQQYVARLAGGLARPSRLKLYAADSADAYVAAFERMAHERISAVVIQKSPFSAVHQRLIAELAAKHRFAGIADGRGFAEAGLLMSYTLDFIELYRRAAEYVHKILEGATPNDLPVGHASKCDLVINLRTAKVLGIRVPRSVLISADTLIE